MNMRKIGIIGMGIAGRARARAVLSRPHLELVGVHRGRYRAAFEVPVVEDPAALLKACDLVIICSPTDTHEAWVERALEARCDVIVEFPLAMSALGARKLYEKAAQVGRRLHVEHIERLSMTTTHMVAGLSGGATLEFSELVFSSRGAPFKSVREHAIYQLPRLHRLMTLGPIDSVRCDEITPTVFQATVAFQGGGKATVNTSRGPDLPRAMTWTLRTSSETRVVKAGQLWVGDVSVGQVVRTDLFGQDLDLCLQRWDAGEETYVPQATIMRAYGWVEELISQRGTGRIQR